MSPSPTPDSVVNLRKSSSGHVRRLSAPTTAPKLPGSRVLQQRIQQDAQDLDKQQGGRRMLDGKRYQASGHPNPSISLALSTAASSCRSDIGSFGGIVRAYGAVGALNSTQFWTC